MGSFVTRELKKCRGCPNLVSLYDSNYCHECRFPTTVCQYCFKDVCSCASNKRDGRANKKDNKGCSPEMAQKIVELLLQYGGEISIYQTKARVAGRRRR